MINKSAELARSITRTSSKQSYYTARLMVDPDLELDCYRAYGYFRWVDDVVDIDCTSREARVAFIQRQQDLVDRLYRREHLGDIAPQEQILVDLIQNDRGENYRLRSYVRNFLAIIEFDAERKGCLVSERELDWYASTLGKAVTDGIQYFVGHTYPYPDSEKRYLAATGAHIAHMLRDLHVDILDGYYNVPAEQLEAHRIDFLRLDSPAMQAWVEHRVQLARQYFSRGKEYLDGLTVLRCKIVGYWYCARFETLLDTIERDGYILRSAYPKPNKWITWLRFAGIALNQMWGHARYHLKNGSGLCGWSQKRVENPLDVIPEYE